MANPPSRKNFFKQLAIFVGIGALSGALVTTSPRRPVELRMTDDIQRTTQLERKATTNEAKEFYQKYKVALEQLKHQGIEKIWFDPLDPEKTKVEADVYRMKFTNTDARSDIHRRVIMYGLTNPTSKLGTAALKLIEKKKEIISYNEYCAIMSQWALEGPMTYEMADMQYYFKKNKTRIIEGSLGTKPRPIKGALFGAATGLAVFGAWRKRDDIRKKMEKLRPKKRR